MKKQQSKAFTLVELIVVITILSVLVGVATISYKGYSSNSRDANRTRSIRTISRALDLSQTNKSTFSLPDNYVNISASGNIISYQGTFGDSVAKTTDIKDTPKDPLDNTGYIYQVDSTKTRYQLLTFLENKKDSSTAYNQSLINNAYAIDYTSRIPYVAGDKLGVLLDNSNNPISSSVDVITTTQNYKAVINNTASGIISGTGTNLAFLKDGAGKSCNDIMLMGKSKGDGIYYINPTGTSSFQVYCDMTNDGGGWTLCGNGINFDIAIKTSIPDKSKNFFICDQISNTNIMSKVYNNNYSYIDKYINNQGFIGMTLTGTTYNKNYLSIEKSNFGCSKTQRGEYSIGYVGKDITFFGKNTSGNPSQCASPHSGTLGIYTHTNALGCNYTDGTQNTPYLAYPCGVHGNLGIKMELYIK